MREDPRVKLLHSLFASIESATTLQQVFETVYEVFPRFLGVGRASLMLYDEKADALISDHLIGVERKGENLRSAPQLTSQSISGRCFTTGQPVIVNDCSQTDLIPPEIVEALQLKSTIAVPIKTADRVIGVLRVDDLQRTGRFFAPDEDFYTLVAEKLAGVIENARRPQP